MAEIGWIISGQHAGHGYGTEAAQAMLRFAFHDLHARLVTAVIQPDNHRSLALAARLGFTEQARDSRSVLLALTRHRWAGHACLTALAHDLTLSA